MKVGNRTVPCALGRSGPSVFKREGDGATPACRPLRPLAGFYRRDRVIRPQSVLQFDPVLPHDGWCDAPTHPSYNELVRLPFARSHEVMMRDDALYNIGIVLDWNMRISGRKRFGGSAIFMHLAKPGFQPTEGCIALKERDMRWLLRHIDQRAMIIVER